MAGGQGPKQGMKTEPGEPLPPQVTSPDAPEFQPRSSHPYEGPGSGQVESRLPEEAVSYGLGSMERKASERLGHELGSSESLPHPKPEEVAGKEVIASPKQERQAGTMGTSE